MLVTFENRYAPIPLHLKVCGRSLEPGALPVHQRCLSLVLICVPQVLSSSALLCLLPTSLCKRLQPPSGSGRFEFPFFLILQRNSDFPLAPGCFLTFAWLADRLIGTVVVQMPFDDIDSCLWRTATLVIPEQASLEHRRLLFWASQGKHEEHWGPLQ